MAVTSFRRSGLTNLIKYDRFTAGNESDFALIASQTVGSGGASSITFDNIPQGYRHLQIRGIGRSTRANEAGDALACRFNADTLSNYSWHFLYGIGTTSSDIYSTGATSTTSMLMQRLSGPNALSNTFGAFIIDVLEYANTTTNKTLRALGGMDENGFAGNTTGYIALNSGNWRSTNAITSITIFAANGNLAQFSNASLYGVR